MKPPFEHHEVAPSSYDDEMRDRLIGLGDRSMRKSYYPELRKRLAELEHAGEFMHSLVDAMPSMLACVDKDLKLTLVNVLFADVTGVDPDDVKGSPLAEVLHWLPEIPAAMSMILRDGKPRVLRKIPSARTDAPGWYDATVFPLANGEAAVRIDDVTARVHMEEMLVQTEKTLSMGTLAAGMAHEINNPLGGIIQSAQVLTKRLTEDFAANRRAAEEAGCSLDSIRFFMERRSVYALLSSILDSGTRAANIVRNMLKFSRKSTSEYDESDLNDLLEKSLELCSTYHDNNSKYNFKNIKVIKNLCREMRQAICMPTELQQVFVNLLTNAAQAMASTINPTIIIRTKSDDYFAQIEIEDNGPGIPEEVRKRIFDPFFTTKPVGEGTGLGLSVSFFIIVSHHHGTIEAESAPGEGTRFIIRLPLSPPVLHSCR